MRAQIIEINQTKDKSLLALEVEYEKRLSPYIKLETTILRASKSDQREMAQAEEAKLIQEKLDKDAFIIALDEHGQEFTSIEFAQVIEEKRDHGIGKIQFIIGGSHGIHKNILARASLIISFSRMTFTHEMIRVFLKEQLYRAFMIIHKKTYHK